MGYKSGTITTPEFQLDLLSQFLRIFLKNIMSSAIVYMLPATLCLLVPPAISQVPGGVTAAKGFKAAGMYGGLRAKGEKPDLALVTCDVDAIAAGELSSCLFSLTVLHHVVASLVMILF